MNFYCILNKSVKDLKYQFLLNFPLFIVFHFTLLFLSMEDFCLFFFCLLFYSLLCNLFFMCGVWKIIPCQQMPCEWQGRLWRCVCATVVGISDLC